MDARATLDGRFTSEADRSSEQPICRMEPLEGRTLLSGATTVDDYQMAPGKHTILNGGMATDGAGNVYAAGEAYDSSGVQHDIVRVKLADNATWATLSDQVSPLNYNDIAVTSAGDIYVGGFGGGSGWTIMRMRRSLGETAFSVVDQPAFAGSASCTSLTIDPAGNVYAVGSAVTSVSRTTSVRQWIVRKQSGGTGSFATVDAYRYPDRATYANDVTVIPTGPAAGIYVVGRGGDNPTDHWLVRRSGDGGISWTLIDDYQMTPSTSGPARAYSVIGDAAGNVYVGGFAQSKILTGGTKNKPTYTSTSYGVTRRGTLSAGGSWTWSVDDQFASGGNGSGVQELRIGSGGHVYAAGDANWNSIVRSKVDGAWSTVDDFLYPGTPSGYDSTSTGLAIDARGDVFVGVVGYDATGSARWIVRQLTPTAAAAESSTPFSSPSISSSTTDQDSLLESTPDGLEVLLA